MRRNSVNNIVALLIRIFNCLGWSRFVEFFCIVVQSAVVCLKYGVINMVISIEDNLSAGHSLLTTTNKQSRLDSVRGEKTARLVAISALHPKHHHHHRHNTRNDTDDYLSRVETLSSRSFGGREKTSGPETDGLMITWQVRRECTCRQLVTLTRTVSQLIRGLWTRDGQHSTS